MFKFRSEEATLKGEKEYGRYFSKEKLTEICFIFFFLTALGIFLRQKKIKFLSLT